MVKSKEVKDKLTAHGAIAGTEARIEKLPAKETGIIRLKRILNSYEWERGCRRVRRPFDELPTELQQQADDIYANQILVLVDEGQITESDLVSCLLEQKLETARLYAENGILGSYIPED